MSMISEDTLITILSLEELSDLIGGGAMNFW